MILDEFVNNKKQLFENWDGKDYYDGVYIKDNFILQSGSKEYPTIDHKTSVSYGIEKIKEYQKPKTDDNNKK